MQFCCCVQLLLAPAMNHAHLVQTYTTRCAELTDEFFNFLEGGGSSAATYVVTVMARLTADS